MTDVPDSSEPAPTTERTSVLAVDDLEAHDVRRALVTLAALSSPSLAPLVRSAAVPGGVALTHRVPSGAVSLASLRAAGPLRAGHVLAVGVAVLEALVVLHDAGLAHGGVEAGAVLVGPDGAVVLAATGASWTAAPGTGDGPTPEGDVEAVGALVRDLLGPGSAPAPLVVAVVRALDPDLALRPDAAGLLDALGRCSRPDSLLDALWAPRSDARGGAVTPTSASGDVEQGEVRAGDGPSGDQAAADVDESRAARTRPLRPQPRAAGRRPGRSGARPPRRRPSPAQLLLFAGVLVAVLALAGLVGAMRTGRDEAPSTAAVAALQAIRDDAAVPEDPSADPLPAASPESSVAAQPASPPADGAAGSDPVDWRAVLSAADAGRTAALATGSEAGLRDWVTGTAYAADLALARTVANAGARIEGGGLVLEDVTAVSVARDTAVLRVRDRRTGYAVVVDGGRQEVPERAARTWTVTLVRGGSPVRWRISEVADAVLSPGGRR